MSALQLTEPSKKRVFIASLILVLFGPVAIDIYLPALPAMQQEFGGSAAMVQLSLSLFVLALGFGQLIVGPLADRFGRRPIALAGVIVYGLSAVAISNVGSLESLLWLRVLQGLGASCSSVVAMTVVRDRYSPDEGAKVYGYINGLLCVAPALAPVLGGLLVELFGWRSNFTFLALFAAVGVLFILTTMPETRPKGTHVVLSNLLSTFVRILKNGPFVGYALCCMMALAVVLNFAILSPSIFMANLGFSTLQFSLVFGANALVIMAGSFIAPKFTAAHGRLNTIVVGSLLMLIGGAAMWASFILFGYSLWAVMMPMVVVSVGFSGVLGGAASLALEPFNDCAGTASSLLGCIQFLGASLTSMLLIMSGLADVTAMALIALIAGAYGVVLKIKFS